MKAKPKFKEQKYAEMLATLTCIQYFCFCFSFLYDGPVILAKYTLTNRATIPRTLVWPVYGLVQKQMQLCDMHVKG